VRTATGKTNDENLHAQSWEVSEFIGKEAVLEVADNSTGGHINVDQIEQRDQSAEPLENKTRQITIEKRYLRLPIDNNGVKRRLQIIVGGKGEPGCSLQLANGDTPDWWAWMNVSAWKGKEIALSVDQLPAYSTALGSIRNFVCRANFG
jgi:fructan beta-fructosidase